jgi:hypothetical protein
MEPYPDDADGAVLAMLAEQGVNMTQPLNIEFAVAVADENVARAVAKAIADEGYDAEIYHDTGEEEDEEGEDDDDGDDEHEEFDIDNGDDEEDEDVNADDDEGDELEDEDEDADVDHKDDAGDGAPGAEEYEPSWTVYAKVTMVPEYAEIIRTQEELDRIAAPHGGVSDGWGTLTG